MNRTIKRNNKNSVASNKTIDNNRSTVGQEVSATIQSTNTTAISKPQKPTITRQILRVLAIAIIFGSGIMIGSLQEGRAAQLSNYEQVSIPLADTPASGLDLGGLWQAWSLLESKFVSTEDRPDSTDKVEGLIKGLAESYGDPYTQFFNAEELERFNQGVEGESFSGVGMEVGVNQDGLLRVVAPLKNTPAEEAGVMAGDIILQIDDVQSLEISVDEAISLIRGPSGTIVELLVARSGAEAPILIPIERQTIEVPVLQTEIIDNVFIISIYTFSADLGDKFRLALDEYRRSDTEGLVLDVRNNPGGYLYSAVELGSWFTERNDVLVRELSDQRQPNDERLYRSKGYELSILDQQPVVVIVNKGSASASEILAGIIKDYNKGEIIGDTTFGKGSVQELIPLKSGSALKITTAKWLTPNGQSISNGGLEPDIEIADDPTTVEIDEQLQRAIEVIINS